MPKKKSFTLRVDCCAFCQKDEKNPLLGDLVEKAGMKFHTNCIFASSGLSQDREETFTDENYINGFYIDAILKEVKRGKHLYCSYCRYAGASIGCAVGSCHAKFHLPCVTKAKGVTLFEDPFPTYCHKHSTKQDLTPYLKRTTEPPTCCVCLFSLLPDETSPTSCSRSTAAPSSCESTNSMVSRPLASSKSSVERKLPRRSCMTASTPKRIRISVQCDDVQRLSVSDSASWEISECPSTDYRKEQVIVATPRHSIPFLPSSTKSSSTTALNHLPQWLRSYLLSLPVESHKSAYESWLHETIHGGCCPKAWMHRNCIAGYAVSAALHYLKCPYCADRQTFIPNLVRLGIWVPDRDAAWELEPGAYAGLLLGPTGDEDTTSDNEEDSCLVVDTNTITIESETPHTAQAHERRRSTRTRRGRDRVTCMDSQTSDTESDESKVVYSLVWPSGPIRPPPTRRNSQITRNSKPSETTNLSRRGARRHTSAWTGHRLRQVTLGSFLTNVRLPTQ